MTLKSIPKLKASQYKMMNSQRGSVIVHNGEFIALTFDGQWLGICTPYPVEAPTCIDGDYTIEHQLIDVTNDGIIDGRFIAWQIGPEWWLYICPCSRDGKFAEVKPYLVQYHKYTS